MRTWLTSNAKKFKPYWDKWGGWIKGNVPPGLRAPVGVLLIVGGIFGMMPVLGFWMIPLGVGVIAMDVSALRNAIRRRGKQDDETPPE